MVEALDLDDHRTHCWVQTRDARLECDERLLVSGASTSQGRSKAADAVLAGADGRTRQTARADDVDLVSSRASDEPPKLA